MTKNGIGSRLRGIKQAGSGFFGGWHGVCALITQKIASEPAGSPNHPWQAGIPIELTHGSVTLFFVGSGSMVCRVNTPPEIRWR